MVEPRAVIVVRERRSQRNILFGFLAVVVLAAPILALVRGGPHDTDDTIVMIVLGVVGVLVVFLWISLARHPRRLVVSSEIIRLEREGAVDNTPPLSRSPDDRLLFVLGGSARSRFWMLTNSAGDSRLSLQFFNKREVERACIAAGWRVE
jgi:hypothetical protein